MKAIFKKDELKNILDVVKKGMGNGVILPITEYIEFLFVDDVLFVTSTNLTTWVTYKVEFEVDFDTGEDGVGIIIDGNKITQLVEKTSVPEIEFTIHDDFVEVKGNGEYKIPKLNEEFPNYNFEPKETHELDIGELKNAIELNKAAVAKDMIMPCLSGFHISDKVVTTDSIKMTINDVKILDAELLLPKDVTDLLPILPNVEGTIELGEGNLLIDTPNVTIFGPILDGIEEYPNLDGIIETEFPAEVEINIKNIIAVLDRLTVFAQPFDINVVEIEFDEHFITLKNRDKTTVERINYSRKIDFKKGETVAVDIDNLLELMKNTPGETIRLSYGNPGLIRLENDNITHYLSQVGDD